MFYPRDREGGQCDVRGEPITIWVATDAADAKRIREMPDPKHWFSVTWVKGPNWFIATINRAAALEVQHAIGGELHGVDV
jgi:hypothetical protein